MLAVIVTIMKITEGLYAVLAVSVTITGMSICSVSSYCDNNDNNMEVYM